MPACWGKLLKERFTPREASFFYILFPTETRRADWFSRFTCTRPFFNPLYTGHPERGTLANIADPDQMPHNVASDQGLHCLLTGFSIKNRIKATK